MIKKVLTALAVLILCFATSVHGDVVVDGKPVSSATISAYTDVTTLWGSGSCSGLLNSDGTCKAIGTDVQAYDANTMKKAAAALTTGQYVVPDAEGNLISAGAPVTDNSTASHLLCKDSAGEVENCGGVTISGTTSPVINVNPQEVDGHVTSTDLTAAQVSNTVIHNYDQADSDVFLIAPAAAAGYSALFTVATAQSKHWCFEAAANDKIYLIAAAGTVTAGDDGAAVCMMAAQVGQSFACWTFKTGATSYDWMCKAISIGTSTFEAHASSE